MKKKLLMLVLAANLAAPSVHAVVAVAVNVPTNPSEVLNTAKSTVNYLSDTKVLVGAALTLGVGFLLKKLTDSEQGKALLARLGLRSNSNQP